MNYTIDPTDIRLHTRFSNLSRCTPNQVDQLLADIKSGRTMSTEATEFGSLRHSQWEQYARKHNALPPAFGLPYKPTYIEEEYTSEIWKDIIIHSRPDVVCEEQAAVVDYKTVLDGIVGKDKTIEQYRHPSKQRQLMFYAYQLGLHGIKINKGVFLLEVWNKEHDTILDNVIVEFPITLVDIANTINWAKTKVALLASVWEADHVNQN